MNRKTIAKIGVVSLLVVLFFSMGQAVTIEATTAGYDLQAEDKLDQLDIYVNATAEITSRKADSKRLNFESRVSLVTSKTLAPLVYAQSLKHKTMIQPGLVDLPYYYQLQQAQEASVDYERLFLESQTKVANDTGEFSGYNNAYEDTFSVKDDLEATTTLSMNSSDWVNAPTPLPDYGDFTTELKKNASETDFMSTSTYEDAQSWKVQVSGIPNVETEFIKTMEANVAANNSVDVDDVHITWYNLTSANLTSYLSENLVSAIRGAASSSASYTVAFSYLGVPLLTTTMSALPFFTPVAVQAADISLRNTIGRVINLGKTFVSKTLPTYATQIQKTVAGTITKAQNTLKPIVNAGLSSLTQVSKQIQTLGKDLSAGFTGAVTKLQTYVASAATKVWDMVSEKLTSTYNMVSKGFGGILGAIPQAISTAISYLPYLLVGLAIMAVVVVLGYWYFTNKDW